MHRTLILPIVFAGILIAAPAAQAAGFVTRSYTGVGDHTWIVPEGVDEATIVALGGSGGSARSGSTSVAGGMGARVEGDVAVSPGQEFALRVAGAGAHGNQGGGGGYGGGGESGYRYSNPNAAGGGGGASRVVRNGVELFVAGGGGGAGSWGGGGGNSSEAGAQASGWAGAGGSPGLAGAGGAGGAGGVISACSQTPEDGGPGGDGTDGAGGRGGTGAYPAGGPGGGGGAGRFGGGGGGGGSFCINFNGGGGGGGGSSYVDPSVERGLVTEGVRVGSGAVYVIFEDTLAPVASPAVSPAANAAGWVGTDAVVTWNWDDRGGAGPDPAACPASTTSAGEGELTLSSGCRDTVGNESPVEEVVVKVDTTAPGVVVSAPVAGSYAQGEEVVVDVVCSDGVSGVESCEASTDDGETLDTSSPGEHVFWASAVDVAGNTARVEVPYTVVAPPAAPAPAAPSTPLAPESVPVPAAAEGSTVTPRLEGADPLVFRPAARVACRNAEGTFDSCRVVVRARSRVIARGRASGETVRLRLTRTGRRLLGRSLGGAHVRVTARATGGGAVSTWTVRRRALLGTERIVTPAGTFAANTARLTPVGRRFVARITARVRALRAARCDGYAAGRTITRTNALEISQDRAARVCEALVAGTGIRARTIGHGTTRPIADNTTLTGRAKNRRVVITLHH